LCKTALAQVRNTWSQATVDGLTALLQQKPTQTGSGSEGNRLVSLELFFGEVYVKIERSGVRVRLFGSTNELGAGELAAKAQERAKTEAALQQTKNPALRYHLLQQQAVGLSAQQVERAETLTETIWSLLQRRDADRAQAPLRTLLDECVAATVSAEHDAAFYETIDLALALEPSQIAFMTCGREQTVSLSYAGLTIQIAEGGITLTGQLEGTGKTNPIGNALLAPVASGVPEPLCARLAAELRAATPPQPKRFIHQMRHRDFFEAWRERVTADGRTGLAEWLAVSKQFPGIWLSPDQSGWWSGQTSLARVSFEIAPDALFFDPTNPTHLAVYAAWKQAAAPDPGDWFALARDVTGQSLQDSLRDDQTLAACPTEGRFFADLGLAGFTVEDKTGGHGRPWVLLNPNAVDVIRFGDAADNALTEPPVTAPASRSHVPQALAAVLDAPELRPSEVLDAVIAHCPSLALSDDLKARHPALAPLGTVFELPAQSAVGPTVRAHTADVLTELDTELRHFDLDAIPVKDGVNLRRTVVAAIALHDAYKGVALLETGSTTAQHAFNQPGLRAAMAEMGFSDAEIDLADALIGEDLWRDLRAHQHTERWAFAELCQAAHQAHMNAASFFMLALLYHTVDACAYPNLRTAFPKTATGERLPADPAIQNLAKMFGLDWSTRAPSAA
jgi:hypothetical protein